MKSTAILELMTKDHIKIIKYLDIVEKNLRKDPNTVMPFFHTFEWNLEKHFFVEERAIFTSYNPDLVDEGYTLFLDLAKQHTILLEKLRSLKKKLQNKKAFDFNDFKRMLMKHKNFEEESVYPVLDQEIDEGEKRFIIERINEITS